MQGLEEIYKPSRWGEIYHALPDWEALGAGAAGPGKSMVLLFDPLPQIAIEHERCANPRHPYHQPWGMSKGLALHLRRTRPMLEQTMKRANQAFPRIDPGAHWSEQKSTWTFSSGYQVQFGHCKDPDDWMIYQGNEYTHIAFDELVQFDEEQYDQICYRLRTGDPVLRKMLKIRSMSNPLTGKTATDNFTVKNPHWVRDRFIEPAREGGVRLRKRIKRFDGSEEVRTFIYLRATLYDNPDPEFVRQYEVTLRASKKPHLIQAYLYGNWYINEGSFFAGEWNDQIHICEPFRIPADWRRFRSMDWGYKKPGCVHWWAIDHDDTLYCEREYTFQEKTDAEVARRIREIETEAKLWGKKGSLITGPADTQLWEERGESAKSKALTMQALGVGWVPADKKSRVHNAERLTTRLRAHERGTRQPGIVFFNTCKKAITTIPTIQADPKDPEVPVDGGSDHWLDSALYACAYVSHGAKSIPRLSRFDEEEHEEPRRSRRGNWGYGGA